MAEYRFYVHIVESPSPDDLLDGRTEGTMLCSFLKLAGIPCQYNLVTNNKTLRRSLTDRVREAATKFTYPPIVHLSAHGDENGIQLTAQNDRHECVVWAELRDLLRPIHQTFGGLGVCMSSCGGLFGRKMAYVVDQSLIPLGWLLGSEQSLPYPDAAIAFAVFYRRFWKGASREELLEAIRSASGISDFKFEYGDFVQGEYARLTNYAAALNRLSLLGRGEPY